MIPSVPTEILEYLTRWPQPFCDMVQWSDAHAAVKVAVAITRLGHGIFSTAKGVGGGSF